MVTIVEPAVAQASPRAENKASLPRFGEDDGFGRELRLRVDAHFRERGLSGRDAPSMFAKSVLVLGFTAAVYVLLVFFARTWWQAVPLAISLGLGMANWRRPIDRAGRDLDPRCGPGPLVPDGR